ncbi:MAG: helix-turn-helix domain-containing protein [Lachnospiraceae bacterium]|nr:helix-turn-helix domain-containing protein [Lachnospiraceae bacterium]
MTKEYIIPKYTTAEEIKYVRNLLKMTQKEFAEFIGISKPTVERWETQDAHITGPIVFLLEILRRDPQIKDDYTIPPRKYPIRLKYYYKNMLCTVIDVDETNRRVAILNYTDNLIYRAFGKQEKPTFNDYEDFLESRCFPKSRDKMKLVLRQYNLPFYDPFLIIEKTKGRMEEDEFHIEIER